MPKRLRYHLQADPAVLNAALHIFLSAVEKGLRSACPAVEDNPPARIGAVAFIHRFGALLNSHRHFHCVVVDGVYPLNFLSFILKPAENRNAKTVRAL